MTYSVCILFDGLLKFELKIYLEAALVTDLSEGWMKVVGLVDCDLDIYSLRHLLQQA